MSLLDVAQTLVMLDVIAWILAGGWTLELAALTLRSPGPLISVPLVIGIMLWRRVRGAGWDSSVRGGLAAARRHRYEFVLAALLVPGLALRFWGLRFGLPIMAHHDEPDVIGPVLSMIQNGTFLPGWYIYPSLQMYVLMPFVALVCLSLRGNRVVASVTDISPFEPGLYVAARSVSAVLGALTIVPLYRAGTALFDRARGRQVGLIAAVLVTFSFLHVRESHHAVTDVLLMFLLTSVLIPVAGILQRERLLDYALAGFLGGLAGATKYSALPIVVVIVAAHLLGRPPRRWWSHRPLMAALGLGLGFVTGTPGALLRLPLFLDHLGLMHGVSSPILEPASRFAWVFGYSLESGFGPVFGWALWISLAAAVYRRRPTELLLAIDVLAFVALITRSEIDIRGRYLLTAMPAAALLVGWYGVLLRDWAAHRLRLPRPVATGVLASLLAAAVVPQALESIAWDRQWSRTHTRALAYEWASENLPEGSVIYSEAWIRAVPRGVEFDRFEPLRMRPGELRERGADYAILSSRFDGPSPPGGAETRRARRRLRQRLTELQRFEAGDTYFGEDLTLYAVPPPRPDEDPAPDGEPGEADG